MKPEGKKAMHSGNPGCKLGIGKNIVSAGHYFGDWYRHESFSNVGSSCSMGGD